MATFDVSGQYVLKNDILGSANSLTSTPQNASLVLSPAGTNSNQIWSFVKSNADNFYRMQNKAKDFASLDIYYYIGRPTMELHFYATQDATSQYWALNKQSDGTYKIWNNLTGDGMYLDVEDNTQTPVLKVRDSSRQKWTLSSLGSTPTATALSSSISGSSTRTTVTPTASGTGTVSAPSSTSTPQNLGASTASKSNGPSNGAIAGIVVGAVIGAALLGWLSYFLYKKHSAPPKPVTPPSGPGMAGVYHA